MLTLQSHINNPISIREDSFFTCIIGEKPSLGARSPVLWNAVYDKLNIENRMYSFDVSPEKLSYLLDALEKNEYFVGGAVTMPYKEVVYEWLGSKKVSQEAENIGAVNCIYRGGNGLLFGTNTDGEAALEVLKKETELNKNINILQLGCGGAGRAVAAYLTSFANLKIVVRDKNKLSKFANRIGASLIDWNDIDQNLVDTDIIVNTTSVGFREQSSPLDFSQMSSCIKCKVLFDIIYEPSPTKLIELAKQFEIKVIDGKLMNILQAVLAFSHTNKVYNKKFITDSMSALSN
jgi:shikimate dehydrogenase